MGAEYFEGKKLRSLLHWVNENFAECIILVADTLHRHNLMSKYLYSEEKARQESLEMGRSWIERNNIYINHIQPKTKLFRWDDWLLRSDTQETIVKFCELYKNEPQYRDAVHKDATNFLNRKSKRNELIRDKEYFLKKSADYLLEESAVDTIMAPLFAAIDAYPGPELECQRLIRLGQIPQVPNSIRFFVRAEVKFK
jgi:tRNA-dependent cyclodipeptide synthase